jgi:UDP-galactopyranose mutase
MGVSGRQHIGVAGAGWSGAVVARQLAEAGHRVEVFDPRPHVAGNCHTERHPTGVLVHRYGPHIFHTASDRVWDYVRRFGTFRPYVHQVRATVKGHVYALPVNLLTINQFFGTDLDAEAARCFVAARCAPGSPEGARTFEELAHRTIGPELYDAFFAGYTRKQWGIHPAELPASVFARLPVRFTSETAYFDHPHQGMPVDGYTAVVEAILDHPGIAVWLGVALSARDVAAFDHTYWTGPLDSFFDHSEGRLTYRTLDFDVEVHDGDHQGCAVMNHCDVEVPVTRVTEHRHFAPWERHDVTVVTSETPRAHTPGDVPYYPVRLVDDDAALRRYAELARDVRAVTFLGRLGTFRYIDMDRAVADALDAADRHLDCVARGDQPPAFVGLDVAH